MGRNYAVCVKSDRDGKTYCYDQDRRMLVIVSEESVPLGRIPEDVLKALLDRAVFVEGKGD